MGAFGVLLDSLLDNPDLGVDIVYTPASGSPVSCRASFAQPDMEAQLATSRVRDRKRWLLVKQSDIAQPAKGAQVAIGTDTLRVLDFWATDPSRLTWTLSLGEDC
jgi:hypothetical protein